MNLNNLYLYLACGGYPRDNETWIFLTSVGEVEIKNANDILHKLLPLCNGEKRKREILEEIEDGIGHKDRDKLNRLVLDLLKLGILSDSLNVFKTWKAYGENPMIFASCISPDEIGKLIQSQPARDKTKEEIKINIPDSNIGEIFKRRCSTRDFMQGVLREEDIAGLFWSAYGIQEDREKIWKYGKEKTMTVPSGGGLYSLVLYLIELEDFSRLSRGIYRWNSVSSAFERMQEQGDLEDIENIVNGVPSLEGATGIMVIAADYGRVAKKYANKAYPLVLLEAGHSMQNAYLYCAEKGVGFVELLGFDQDGLSKTLKQNKSLDPVALGVFGAKKEG